MVRETAVLNSIRVLLESGGRSRWWAACRQMFPVLFSLPPWIHTGQAVSRPRTCPGPHSELLAEPGVDLKPSRGHPAAPPNLCLSPWSASVFSLCRASAPPPAAQPSPLNSVLQCGQGGGLTPLSG